MTLYTVHPDTRDADGQRVAGVWVKNIEQQQAQADVGLAAEVEATDDGLELN